MREGEEEEEDEEDEEDGRVVETSTAAAAAEPCWYVCVCVSLVLLPIKRGGVGVGGGMDGR